MYRLIMLTLVIACAVPVHAQDILYYKFEKGAGNTVVNCGDVTPGIPRLGQVLAKGSAPIAQAWGPGRFRSGGLAAAPVSPGLGYGLPTSSVILAIGSNNQQFAGIPLPLDLGPSFPALQGCHLRTSADLLVVPTVIGAPGGVDIPLPIPPFPALEGFIVYARR